jgi:hypothetical protein
VLRVLHDIEDGCEIVSTIKKVYLTRYVRQRDRLRGFLQCQRCGSTVGVIVAHLEFRRVSLHGNVLTVARESPVSHQAHHPRHVGSPEANKARQGKMEGDEISSRIKKRKIGLQISAFPASVSRSVAHLQLKLESWVAMRLDWCALRITALTDSLSWAERPQKDGNGRKDRRVPAWGT